jgi:microcystin-dependent protein/uncharacterized membrane protein
MVIFTETSNQGLLLGTQSSNMSSIAIRGRNINVNGNLGVNTMTPRVAIDVNTTDAIRIPVGTVNERPANPQTGYFRFNTSTNTFEAFGGVGLWETIGGGTIKDLDQNTMISMEEYPGANDDIIRFINSNDEKMRIMPSGRVGIGLSNPSDLLHVNGNMRLESFAFFHSNLTVGGTTMASEKLDVRGSIVASENIYAMINMGVGTRTPTEDLEVDGNAKITSNLFVMHNIGIATSNPARELDVAGSAIIRSNLEVIGNLNVKGVVTTINSTAVTVADNVLTLNNAADYLPTLVSGLEIDRGSNYDNVYNVYEEQSGFFKVGKEDALQAIATREDVMPSMTIPFWNSQDKKFIANSNLTYLGEQVGVGLSNPTERLDVSGNIRASSNVYTMVRHGVATSNPTEAVDIHGNAKISSNLYVLNRTAMGGHSNPTESLDLLGNIKASSNAYIMSRLSVANSNPTESIDATGNIKASSNAYVMSRLGVGTSNPTVSITIQAQDAILIPSGTTDQRPSALTKGMMRYNMTIDKYEGYGAGGAWGTIGGVRDTNNDTYITAESFPLSNDDNIVFYNSNLETMRITSTGQIGIGLSNPVNKLDMIGNMGVDGNVAANRYVLCRGVQVKTRGVSQFSNVALPVGVVIGFSNDNLGVLVYMNQATSSNSFRFVASNNELVRITGNGMLGVATSNPTERLDVVGNMKASSNAYVMNRLGVATSNPVEAMDVIGNMAASSNVYAMYRLSVAHSNPAEAMDIIGNTKVSQNIYAMNRLGVATSNPSEQIDVNGNIKAQSIYSTVRLGVATSNPTEQLDVTGNLKATNMYSTSRLGVATSNPTEALDITGNVKASSNIYAMTRMGVATSNPTEQLDVTGNLKATNIYSTSRLGVATSNPSEQIDVIGSVKASSDIYAMTRMGVATSNPSEQLDVAGNLKATNIYSTSRLGVATSNPSEQVDVVGNMKATSNVYVMNRIGVANSNPTVALDVNGSAKITNDLEVIGNFTVQGTTTTVNSTTVNVTDNIVRLNNGAAFNASLQAGLEINRGTGYSNYMLVFDETSQYFKVGQQGISLQTVATRDDNPTSHSLMIYDNVSKKLTACNSLTFSNSVLEIQGIISARPSSGNNAFQGLATGLTSGQFLHIALGQSNTPSNAAVIKYTHNGVNNNTNNAQFGLWGFNHITCSGNGNVGVRASTPSNALDVGGWIRAFGDTSTTAVLSTNNSTSGFSCFQCHGDFGPGLIMYQNGSTRTTDGGTYTATIRNDIGDLRLQASSTYQGINIKSSTGHVGISTSNPTEQLHIASGKLLVSSGQVLGYTGDTSALPAYSWGDDSNTGMYHPTTDTIAFTNNGVETMRIISTGTVGIGTTTPNSSYRVDVNGTLNATSILENGLSISGVPIGSLMPFAGVNAPAGWLMCNGQEVSRTVYVALFAIISTNYGTGNGTTTFNVPDFRGRSPLGASPSYSLASTGGSTTQTLSSANLPPHTHSGSTGSGGDHTHSGTTNNSGGHNHTGSTNSDGSHNHAMNYWDDLVGAGGVWARTARWQNEATKSTALLTTTNNGSHTHTLNINSVGDHTHSFSTGQSGTHTHSFTTDNGPGVSQAFSTMSPYIAVNVIIKC